MIKIAIPTNDRITLAERSGRAREFMVAEVENGVVLRSEFRENSHDHKHEEGESDGDHSHNHNDLVELLSDCKYLLVKVIGKHFKRDLAKAGKIFVLTKTDNIEEAIAQNKNRFI